MTNFDNCFEEHLTQQLSCKPYDTMDLNLPTCINEESLKKSNETLMNALENMNEICQLECHFTNIQISSRNYEERGSRTQAYFYFPYKIKLRYNSIEINFLIIFQINMYLSDSVKINISFLSCIWLLKLEESSDSFWDCRCWTSPKFSICLLTITTDLRLFMKLIHGEVNKVSYVSEEKHMK